jgi:hypothetical protein
VRQPVSRPYGPFSRDIRGDFVKVGLRVVDELALFIAHESQKDFLRDVFHIRRAYTGPAHEEAAQGRPPPEEPVGESALGVCRSHEFILRPGEALILSPYLLRDAR